MKKQNIGFLAVLLLSMPMLLTGCVKDNAARLTAEAINPFPVSTNLEETKQIHTDRQAAYLAYTGNYQTIPEDDYPDGQQHLSDPNPVSLEWQDTINKAGLTRYDVVVGKEADLSDGYAIKGTTATSLNIYNSYLGDNYFKIVANYSDGSKEESPIQKYKVEEVYPRNLKIDGMTNCRDMGGGRVLEDGGKIKQGLLFRTSSTSSWAYGRGAVPDTITADGKEELLTRLGCKTEINVNNSGSSVDGIQKYVQAYMYYDNGKHHLYRNAEPLKQVFHALSDENNYPIFYHCRIGTDRTGLCAILISGLLGVPENLIYQDYLFSNFGNIQEKRYIGDKAGRDNIMNYINDLKAFPGEKFQNKVYNYLLSIGIPASELDSVIDILTEGTKAQGNDNCQEMVLAKDFSSDDLQVKTSSSAAHPSSYYTLEADKSVKATVDAKYSGNAKLIAYLGSTDSSSSKKINAAIKAEFNSEEVEIADELNFSNCGFGSGDGRTYYAAIVLGDVYMSEGENEVVITGIAENLNIGAISVISEDRVAPKGDDKPAKKGCAGSIALGSSLLALVAFAGAGVLVFRKKREN